MYHHLLSVRSWASPHVLNWTTASRRSYVRQVCWAAAGPADCRRSAVTLVGGDHYPYQPRVLSRVGRVERSVRRR